MKLIMGVLTLLSGCFNTNKPTSIHLNSHVNGGCQREEAYIRETNGIIRTGEGIVPWFSSEQVFDRDKFNLCKTGQNFTLVFHSDYPDYFLTVSHIYGTRLVKEGVEIYWIGQKENYDYLKKPYTLFNVPTDYIPEPIPEQGNTKKRILH